MDDDFAKAGAFRGEPVPNPDCEIFKGRIFQSHDFVERAMVEEFDDFPRRAADSRMVVKPAHARIDFALNGNLHAETVSVHPGAFVVFGNIRQFMGRLETEIFCQTDLHFIQYQTPRSAGSQMNLCICN